MKWSSCVVSVRTLNGLSIADEHTVISSFLLLFAASSSLAVWRSIRGSSALRGSIQRGRILCDERAAESSDERFLTATASHIRNQKTSPQIARAALSAAETKKAACAWTLVEEGDCRLKGSLLALSSGGKRFDRLSLFFSQIITCRFSSDDLKTLSPPFRSLDVITNNLRIITLTQRTTRGAEDAPTARNRVCGIPASRHCFPLRTPA